MTNFAFPQFKPEYSMFAPAAMEAVSRQKLSGLQSLAELEVLKNRDAGVFGVK